MDEVQEALYIHRCRGRKKQQVAAAMEIANSCCSIGTSASTLAMRCHLIEAVRTMSLLQQFGDVAIDCYYLHGEKLSNHIHLCCKFKTVDLQ
uniref:Putative ovule protein n=1 Tax=Solanum chacoense TaxID=4108 RepID=A0A0V0H0X4_SOLCH